MPFVNDGQVAVTAANLRAESEVSGIYFLDAAEFRSTASVRKMAEMATTPFTMIYTKTTDLSFGRFALERFLAVAEDTGAAMVYSDHFKEIGGVRSFAPVIDCQQGSLRDDFDFGSVMIYRTSCLKEAVSRMHDELSLRNADLERQKRERAAELNMSFDEYENYLKSLIIS